MQPKAHLATSTAAPRRAQQDPLWVRLLLIGSAILIIGLMVVVPVVNVFYQALENGAHSYLKSLISDRHTRHAMLLTSIVAPIAVGLNVLFGLAAAWAVTRFQFRGKTVLVTLIDLPFAVSPVVAGLSFVLLFGMQGYFGPWLMDHGFKIIFALPGIVIATTFVTLPFIARELIPVMQAQGSDEETAAVSLGANGWQMFWRVTLPNIKWGMLYGVILCTARAVGEFGAVYVVSGRIQGKTDTLPLRVEKLMQDYKSADAFAVASLLTFVALLTLGIKYYFERRAQQDLAEASMVRPAELPTT